MNDDDDDGGNRVTTIEVTPYEEDGDDEVDGGDDDDDYDENGKVVESNDVGYVSSVMPKVRKKRRKLKPLSLHSRRVGYTRLVNVKAWRKSAMVLSQQVDNTMTTALANIPEVCDRLKVDDIKLQSPVNALNNIFAELIDKCHNPKEHVDKVPKHVDLVRPLMELARKTMQSEKKGKIRLNHFTKAMIDSQAQQRTQGKPVVATRPYEVILKVVFFHPYTFLKMQEFLVLGNELLSDLRDNVKEYIPVEMLNQGGVSKSAFFFIEDTFYDDLRDPSLFRLSDSIVEWVNQERRHLEPGLGTFRQSTMQDTRFEDLNIRLGSHYLYQYYGDVRQVFMFTDMRIIEGDDIHNECAYPLNVFLTKLRQYKCRICDTFPAKYVTYNEQMAHENPCFYCTHCYRDYHYDVDGKLLWSNFSVFQFDADAD